MNEKELATRLRDIANNAADADVELRLLADELDPPKPKPEPGTVVWFEFVEDDPDPPEVGIVSSSGNTVVDADGFSHRTEVLRIQPARTLGPRQVAVDRDELQTFAYKAQNGDTELVRKWLFNLYDEAVKAARMEAHDDHD